MKRAFSQEVGSLSDLIEYDGYNIVDSRAFLAKDRYCLINLHGTYYSKSKWIMDEEERQNLLTGNRGNQYVAFMRWLFQTFNVVFVGLDPQDIQISIPLQQALRDGLIGTHFWICPTLRQEARDWASKNHVRLISYEPNVNEKGERNHSHDIISILDDIENYVSHDLPVVLPRRGNPQNPDQIMDDNDLSQLAFNDRAKAISLLRDAVSFIGDHNGFDTAKMNGFIKENILPLQLITSLAPGKVGFDTFGDFRLVEQLSAKGSSTVWTCQLNSGTDGSEIHAIKILDGKKHEDITERTSFRRGIESLYLLSQQNVPVAPRFFYHEEIPLAVVMEFISGTDLGDVLKSIGEITPLDTLVLCKSIVATVQACHKSEAQVLHRDLKPSNIMIEGWFIGYDVEGFSGLVRLTFFATPYCGGCVLACGDTAIEGGWVGSRSGDFG